MVRRNCRVVMRQGHASWIWRNGGMAGGPDPRVEMVAIDIELTDDLGREMRLRSRLEDKHRPERVGTARGGSGRREPLQHSDCLGDGFDRDPFRRRRQPGWIEPVEVLGQVKDFVEFEKHFVLVKRSRATAWVPGAAQFQHKAAVLS